MSAPIQVVDRSTGELLYKGELFAEAIDAVLNMPKPSAFVELIFSTGGFVTCLHVSTFFNADCYVGETA